MKIKPKAAKLIATSTGQQGIQSVEVAAPLLRVLAASSSSLSLSSLSKRAEMPAAKAHRYLVSLIRTGLVEQHVATGEYDLGPLALELGLASLGRIDAVKLADAALTELREETSETVALATWGNHGPTYIRLLQSRRPVTINLQIGSVMPMTYTASGLCFAAFMPENETEALLQKEFIFNRKEVADAPHSKKEFEPMLKETRQHGLARTIGKLAPDAVRKSLSTERAAERLLAGFNAFSGPVFDHQGTMRFALTVVGSAAHVNQAWDGEIAQATKRCAMNLSKRLGFRDE